MKLFLQILLILLVVSTISICAIKPDMHKTVMIYDSAYIVVPEKQIEVERETIPVMEKQTEPIQTVIKVESPKTTASNQIKKETKQVSKVNQTKKQEKKVQTTTTPKKVETKTQTTAIQQKIVEKPQTTKTVEQAKTTEKPKIQKKVLTQKEEEIAWNVWRSNLQNKIMQDVKLPIIPNGIVFKFSFSVDKFGRISNVQTWSTTPTYTPYAIQYIAPVIRSYQGKSILVFPQGTARTITDVTGGWRISENERFSTPHDYNDIEKVIK